MNAHQLLIGVAMAIGLASNALSAQPAAPAQKLMSLRVATGPGSGTFTKVFTNIQTVSPDIPLEEVQTAGASANLDLCLKIAAELCFMQADYLWASWKLDGKEEVRENLRTVLPLYYSPLHMIATSPSILKFSDFAGKRIGTFGGGSITLRILMGKAGITADVKNFSKETQPEVAMMTALQKGTIDVAVGIGGKPLKWASTVNTPQGLQIPGAHLVKFDKWDTVKDLAVGEENGFYKLMTLDYDNMSGTAQTVSVMSLLIAARNWGPNEPETKAIQALYRSVTSQLPMLKDPRRGFHESWITVTTMRDPAWLWFGNLKAAGK